MHITLIHKPDAGDGQHSKAALKKLLEGAGHRVTYRSTDEKWKDALEDAGDLVLTGGGDGTVGKVARRLVGTGTPFAVLPLGTANNIATKLGWTGPLEEIVAELERAREQPFDVGVARGPWGARRFVEGVGLGPFAHVISFVRSGEDLVYEPEETEVRLERDLRLLRAFLNEDSAQHWGIDLDGERVGGPLLLLEVMNTGLLGPNLRLAPDADVGDGRLDVVVVGETERETLRDYLTKRLAGDTDVTPPRLPVRQAEHVRLTVEASRVHVDDDVWPDEDEPLPPADVPFEVDLRLEAGALTALVPA